MIRNDDGDEVKPFNQNISSATYNSSKNLPLTAPCHILNISYNILKCSVNCFNPDSPNNTSTEAPERAQRIV